MTGSGAGDLDQRRERRRLPLIGLALSVLYVAGVALYLFIQGQNPADLRLNELGDFLGGVSSPLAFLWLVLGFFQQSREIRLSGKALQLQAQEMKRSVDEHRRLAGGAGERRALMPTVLRVGPYRFYFYSHEPNEPPHVHVDRDEATAKVWLADATLARSRGFRPKEINGILAIVADHRAQLLEEWHEHFAKPD